MELNNWTKAHFCAYIFLCIADADENMDKNEIIQMQEFLEHLHFEHENAYELLTFVRNLHRRHSTGLRVNFIRTKARLFLTSQEATNVMDEVEHLILADNNIEKSEIKMYGQIRKALQID